MQFVAGQDDFLAGLRRSLDARFVEETGIRGMPQM